MSVKDVIIKDPGRTLAALLRAAFLLLAIALAKTVYRVKKR